MTQAKRDQNRVPTMIGVSNIDDETPELQRVNPVSKGVLVEQVDSSGVSTDFATSAKQDDIITNVKKYAANAIDEASASVTYVCKEGASTADWYIMKIDESSNPTTFTHATVLNNPTVTTYSAAYTARATLTFGNFNLAF